MGMEAKPVSDEELKIFLDKGARIDNREEGEMEEMECEQC